MKSKIPVPELGQIWKLSDINNDGILNFGEFCVAMKLIRIRVQNLPIPAVLPNELKNFAAVNQNLPNNHSQIGFQNNTVGQIQRVQTGVPRGNAMQSQLQVQPQVNKNLTQVSDANNLNSLNNNAGSSNELSSINLR